MSKSPRKTINPLDPRDPSFLNPFDSTRNVTIAKRTEAEWTGICAQESGDANEYAINLDGWLALARHLKLIVEKPE